MHTFEKTVDCIDTNANSATIGAVIKRIPVATAVMIRRELGFWLKTLCVWQNRASQRRHLGSLDGRLLRDMGMTRAEADLEAAKPFWNA